MSFETTYLGESAIMNAGVSPALTKIHLFKNNFTPVKTSIAADFDEADFDGYVVKDLTYSSTFVNGAGKTQMNADSVTWVRGVGATDNDVYGIFVTDNAGEVRGYELFPAPVPMVNPGIDSAFYQFSPTLANV